MSPEMQRAVAAALAAAPPITEQQGESLAAILTRNWQEPSSGERSTVHAGRRTALARRRSRAESEAAE